MSTFEGSSSPPHLNEKMPLGVTAFFGSKAVRKLFTAVLILRDKPPYMKTELLLLSHNESFP